MMSASTKTFKKLQTDFEETANDNYDVMVTTFSWLIK